MSCFVGDLSIKAANIVAVNKTEIIQWNTPQAFDTVQTHQFDIKVLKLCSETDNCSRFHKTNNRVFTPRKGSFVSGNNLAVIGNSLLICNAL